MSGDTDRRTHRGVHPSLAAAVRVTMFWSVVAKGQPQECWGWQGYRDEDGYGWFFWDGRMRPAHELALSFSTGEVRLPGLDTCHSCHNPPCCNPNHLRFDTRQANVADTVAAGRNHRPQGRLNSEIAETIRQRIAAGAKQQDLADQYGVTNSTISMIKTGKRYAK